MVHVPAALILLALQAAAAAPPAPPTPPADPLAALHGIVVDNIRHCPKALPGETVVCSRDRGFAESYRLPKLDPRYEPAVEKPADALAGVGDATPRACTTVGPAGNGGCTRRDYDAWQLWLHRHRGAPAP